ncbi:MAG: hypothetical protein LQ339_008510 [Xanthoria mediterranea]|nr:MAG: hypothetical protein LQ339_008510 [Xanthoria mediterranea]
MATRTPSDSPDGHEAPTPPNTCCPLCEDHWEAQELAKRELRVAQGRMNEQATLIQELQYRLRHTQDAYTQINVNLTEAQAQIQTLSSKSAENGQELQVAKQSLEHEFRCHEDTERSLRHERESMKTLLASLNKLQPQHKVYWQRRVHEVMGELRTARSSALKLQEEKERAVNNLTTQVQALQGELSQFVSGDEEIEVGTAVLGKRKRAQGIKPK